MEMRKGLAYMLVGMGLAAGAAAAYQKYGNGDLKNTVSKAKTQAQNKLENMM